MNSPLINMLVWIAALSSGLMAGIYFAFSTFVMPALGKIDAAQSITAMNSINDTILRSLFMPVFIGSSIISIILIVLSINKWGEPTSNLILTGGIIYFIGMFLCTAMFNVPLNNSLAGLEPHSAISHEQWAHYIYKWTNWNHVRTIASLIACTIFIYVLSERS